MFDIFYKGSDGAKWDIGRKKVYPPALAVLVLALVLPFSCTKGYSRYMRLPVDAAIASELGWAAVTTAYAKLKASPASDSADVGALRGGTIFACLERRIDPEGSEIGGYWYKCTEYGLSGWVKDKDLQIFASEGLARASLTAAKP